MKNLLKTALFGAALAVAGIGFAQSSTSPQKGDEDRTSTPSSSSSTQPSSTDTNSTGSTTGSATGSTDTYGSKSSPTTPDTYTGTVATLSAGQTLVLTTSNGQTQTFDLTNSPALASSIAVGSKVRVKKSVDASGKTVVTVEPYR